MASQPLFFCLLAVIISTQVIADDPCTEGTGVSDDILGTMSEDFTVNLEEYFGDIHEYIDYTITYSKSQNTARLLKNAYNHRADIIFSFKTQEKIYYDLTKRTCTVTELKEGDMDMQHIGGMNDGRLNSPLGVFYLEGKSGFGSNNIILKKSAGEKQRGLSVDRYTSCQKWNVYESTYVMKVEVDVSNDQWSKTEQGLIPLSVKVTSKDWVDTLNFLNFRSQVPADAFHLREGIFCKGKKSEKPYPPVGRWMSFYRETHDGNNVHSHYVIYDSFDNYTFVQTPKKAAKPGISTEIRDYNTGVAFNIDYDTNSCGSQSIKSLPRNDWDVEDADGNIRQSTPAEFYDNPEKQEYVYMGERYVNNDLTEVWITQYTDASDKEWVIEWFFIPRSTKTYNDMTEEEQRYHPLMPLLQKKYAVKDNENLDSVDVAFFDVEYGAPKYDRISLEPCFKGSEMSHIKLMVNTSKEFQTNFTLDWNKAEWYLAIALSYRIGVNVLRLTDIKLDFKDSGHTGIDFVLLGPVKNAVKNKDKQISLDKAEANIRDQIAQKKFHIFWSEKTGVMGAQSHDIIRVKSLAEAQQVRGDDSSSGYGPGSMAALGICMALIGIGGGGAAAYRFIN